MDILNSFDLPQLLSRFLIGMVGYTVVMTIIFLIHKYVLGRRVLQWSWYLMGHSHG